MAKNMVVGGTFEGLPISTTNGVVLIGSRIVCKHNIKKYEIITEEIRKSGTSALLRGAAGIALLGSIGALAALSAKNKTTYLIAIEWDAQFLNSKDKKKGNKSLIEIDEKLYKALVKSLL